MPLEILFYCWSCPEWCSDKWKLLCREDFTPISISLLVKLLSTGYSYLHIVLLHLSWNVSAQVLKFVVSWWTGPNLFAPWNSYQLPRYEKTGELHSMKPMMSMRQNSIFSSEEGLMSKFIAWPLPHAQRWSKINAPIVVVCMSGNHSLLKCAGIGVWGIQGQPISFVCLYWVPFLS